MKVLYADDDCIEREWTRHGVKWARRTYLGEPAIDCDYFHSHDGRVTSVMAGFVGWYARADGENLAHTATFAEALRVAAEHVLATCCAPSTGGAA